MSLVEEESVDKNVGIISMQDFLHFLKVSYCFKIPALSNDFETSDKFAS